MRQRLQQNLSHSLVQPNLVQPDWNGKATAFRRFHYGQTQQHRHRLRQNPIHCVNSRTSTQLVEKGWIQPNSWHSCGKEEADKYCYCLHNRILQHIYQLKQTQTPHKYPEFIPVVQRRKINCAPTTAVPLLDHGKRIYTTLLTPSNCINIIRSSPPYTSEIARVQSPVKLIVDGIHWTPFH
jgi:hypothetical protein